MRISGKRLRKFLDYSFTDVLRAAFRRVFDAALLYLRLVQDRIQGTGISERKINVALKDIGLTINSMATHISRRNQPHFFFTRPGFEPTLAALRTAYPDVVGVIRARADEVCRHHFDLLGSGPTFLGNPIDWHLDFKTGHRWKMRYYAFIRPAPSPGGYDIKVPWELSRCQHFIWLGQAYSLTQEEKYAVELQHQLLHWVEQNPPKWGVNWTCTMDVAIRIVNWIWAYFLVQNAESLSNEFHEAFFKAALAHGRFIMQNLEVHVTRQGRYTTNHYLANLVGLAYLGILFPEFNEAQAWRDFSLRELEKEMFRQVHADGFDFEGSTSYHRLVLEMFFSVVILARANDIQFSARFLQRLERMTDVVLHITRPHGTAPLIGDQDNGRLHRLGAWKDPQREWVDFRYLLAVGGVLFQRDDFAHAAGDQWQEAIWLLGEEASAFQEALRSRPRPLLAHDPHGFPDAGVYVLRGINTHLIVDAGRNGQYGLGGHAHNDLLSFELSSFGHQWIIDAGTYQYTGDYNVRRLFQSTAFHNTIRVDGQEINRFDPDNLFHLLDDAPIRVHQWNFTDQYAILDAEHTGYTRLKQPLTHRRQILLDRHSDHILIRDQLSGTGVHQVEYFLHFSNAVDQIKHVGPLAVQCAHKDGPALSILSLTPENIQLSISDGWTSPAYGLRTPTQFMMYHLDTQMPREIITLISAQADEEPVHGSKLINVGQNLLSVLNHAQSDGHPTSVAGS